MLDNRIPDPGSRTLSRRSWLAGAILGGLGATAARATEPGDRDKDPQDLTRILERARAVKLPGFQSSRDGHYVVIGDARPDFREGALDRCSKLAAAYLKHFRDKGFTVTPPLRDLVVVTLKDKRSYKAFLGAEVGADAGGHYDLDSNDLVIFDFRGQEDEQAAANPKRLNTFTLVHEAIHQLTFNTGLLDRRADVPLCISEGLAMQGELWQAPRSVIGGINLVRFKVLTNHLRNGGDWLPVDELVTGDDHFAKEETEQLAYSESWLLVHYMMSRPQLPKFREYLKGLAERRDAKQRLDDIKTHFGGLANLDREVRRYASRLP